MPMTARNVAEGQQVSNRIGARAFPFEVFFLSPSSGPGSPADRVSYSRLRRRGVPRNDDLRPCRPAPVCASDGRVRDVDCSSRSSRGIDATAARPDRRVVGEEQPGLDLLAPAPQSGVL